MTGKIIGLTGSVAMGKSTTARLFGNIGCAVHDADAAVHRLMAPGGAAVGVLAGRFDGVVGADGGIDRKALGRHVFADPAELAALERILHPLVSLDRQRFFRQRAGRGIDRHKPVILDIPLLFETGGGEECDLVLVVSAPSLIQRQRFLARPGATEERLRSVLARQMPDWQKRRLADQVIPSGLGLAVALRAVKRTCRLAKSANRRRTRRRAERRRLAAAIMGALDRHAGNRSRHGNHRA
ncbi:MAG: dephospho-CoA kinase [Pseudomonadota bacterium]